MTSLFTSKKSHHPGTKVSSKNGASAMRETVTETGGAKQGLKAWVAVSVTLLALLGALGSGASTAFADSPWWHLTSGSRPAYIHPGAGKPAIPGIPGEEEIQEIAATPGEFEGQPETGLFLEVGGVGVEELYSEPLSGKGAPPLTAAKIQELLEPHYGSGKVKVKAEPEPKNEKLVFRVSSPFGSAPIEVSNIGFGKPSATVVSPGTAGTPEVPATPDGEIYVTAENIGNQSLDGAKTPVRFTDVLPKGLKAIGVAGTQPEGANFLKRRTIECELSTLSCTLPGGLAPYQLLEMRIAVVVEPGAESEKQENKVSISGGEGFVCKEVAPETGSFKNNACAETAASPKPNNFERESTTPVAPASLARPVTVSAAPTPSGVENYELVNEEIGGVPSTHAGSHPFQSTTTIALNQTADGRPLENTNHKPSVNPIALAKDLHFQWPAGMIGNPTPVAQCTDAEFFTSTDSGSANGCPPDSAVGVALVTVNEPSLAEVADVPVPLFNLHPGPGEPARFGFNVVEANAPVVIDTSIRTGGDYGITVSVNNITQTAAFLSSAVTVWGAPQDPSHNHQRGWGCLYESSGSNENTGIPTCSATATQPESHPPAFLSLPTSCPINPLTHLPEPLTTSVEGDTWAQPGVFTSFTGQPMAGLDGCNQLPFGPEIRATPDTHEASKPSGLTVDVHVPQEGQLNSAGLAQSNIKDIAVTLPEGVTLNPSAADGLSSCSEAQIGYLPGDSHPPSDLHFTPTLQSASCPDAAKIGEVTIKTPLLPASQPLTGFVYLASPQNFGSFPEENPFSSLVSMYIVAEDPVSGSLVKLPGQVTLNPNTGQISSTFENTPQLAFEDAELHFFGGERAPLASPARCGSYTTQASFTPWSGNPPVKAQSSFNITTGPNGSPCTNAGQALPFSPSLATGTTNINAGAFTNLQTTISREDGQQNLQSVTLHYPPGVSGLLSGVKLCPEAQANAGTCGPESLIGETIVSVGLGGDPFTVTGGKAYITEKYAGAPFGLSIVNPASAGPFDLQQGRPVVVRAKVDVDPHTAALTITTDPSGPHAIPTIIEGFPLQIKHVNVNINRPGFTFNPTNCSAMHVTGTINSAEGGSSPVSVPFQSTNCAVLKFAPKFAVSTSGKTSKAKGASLTATLSYPKAAQGTQTNITRVKVDLPKQLPSRLTTLQKACTNAQFELNPANCPKESKIGFAKVTTPLLPVPLEGPAIFVSHGGEAFPSLTMVLQGYGVTIDLVGTTFISSKGITSTTFKTVPDTPFNTFTLTLPQGKFSALAANGNLCTSKLAMPTEFIAQNGAKINESTKISVTGCAKKKALTRPQKLAAALKACHKKAKGKRAGCEAAAHKKYGPLKKAKNKGRR